MNEEKGDMKMNDSDQSEQIEVEDDLRCGECGSTEAGGCFYCKMD